MTAHLPPDFRTIGIALGEHPMTSRWQRVTDIPEKDRGAAIALIMVGAVAPGTAISFDGDQLTRLAMIGAENYANNREHFDGMTVLDVGALAADMANRGHLVAADTSQRRLTRAKLRLKRAGVDAALIHHFFGSKVELFRAAIDVQRGTPILAVDPEAVRQRLKKLAWVRDARVERIWDGTSEIQRHIISRAMLRAHGA